MLKRLPLRTAHRGNVLPQRHAFANSVALKAFSEQLKSLQGIKAGLELGVWSAWPPERVLAEREALNLTDLVTNDFDPIHPADVICDIARTPFKDNAFVLIKSDSVFEHVENFPAAISECYRILEPGGLFIANSANFYMGIYVTARKPGTMRKRRIEKPQSLWENPNCPHLTWLIEKNGKPKLSKGAINYGIHKTTGLRFIRYETLNHSRPAKK